eukprot:5601622-Pyramimonas_sp.AAC.1
MVAMDSTHIAQRRVAKPLPPTISVLTPAPRAALRSLLSADLGHAGVGTSGDRVHVAHPIKLADASHWCVACAVCGASG